MIIIGIVYLTLIWTYFIKKKSFDNQNETKGWKIYNLISFIANIGLGIYLLYFLIRDILTLTTIDGGLVIIALLTFISITTTILIYKLFNSKTNTIIEKVIKTNILPKDDNDLIIFLSEALTTDGDHHKQWYLERIAEHLNIEIKSEYEKGIAP